MWQLVSVFLSVYGLVYVSTMLPKLHECFFVQWKASKLTLWCLIGKLCSAIVQKKNIFIYASLNYFIQYQRNGQGKFQPFMINGLGVVMLDSWNSNKFNFTAMLWQINHRHLFTAKIGYEDGLWLNLHTMNWVFLLFYSV